MNDDKQESKCPNGALRGPCAGWMHCPACGPDMWLAIWSHGAATRDAQ